MLNGIIYKPAGKAGEYCPLAVNLYSGCAHGCVYCYAPTAVRQNRTSFLEAKPRKDIIERLTKDAASMRWENPTSPVFLCFTCDPYQPLDVELKLTRQAIEILHFNNLDVMILTKGGARAERDFDLLKPTDWFGVTLTLLDSSESLKWEPEAVLPGERIISLEKAHRLGIKTWVSLEPVINPETSLEIIRQTHQFVDLFKVGKMNYHPLEKTIDWARFGREAVKLLEGLGKEFYIKEDLKRWL